MSSYHTHCIPGTKHHGQGIFLEVQPLWLGICFPMILNERCNHKSLVCRAEIHLYTIFFRIHIMEGDPETLQTVCLSPRQSSQTMRLHYEECVRDVQLLLAQQHLHMEALVNIQDKIHERLQKCSSLQSPTLPRNLTHRNSTDSPLYRFATSRNSMILRSSMDVSACKHNQVLPTPTTLPTASNSPTLYSRLSKIFHK